jgi:uncharacterized protein
MSGFLQFSFRNQSLLLTPARSIFWEEEKILILSDLHLGKSGHFRKSGIAIPQTIFQEDLQRLVSQLQFFKPAHLLIVGDLFHSRDNKEHELFLKWRHDLPNVSMQLVKGNHDILKRQWYADAGITVHDEELLIGDFLFTHDIQMCGNPNANYCFSGHVHPGIRINGIGRQSIHLPCFYFGKQHAVLPAFGKFTGTSLVEAKSGDHVFAVLEDKVMKIQ